MKVRIKLIENVAFVGESKAGTHWLMDGALEAWTQPRPPPDGTVLIGTGGCTAYDVVHILAEAARQSPIAWWKSTRTARRKIPRFHENPLPLHRYRQSAEAGASRTSDYTSRRRSIALHRSCWRIWLRSRMTTKSGSGKLTANRREGDPGRESATDFAHALRACVDQSPA